MAGGATSKPNGAGVETRRAKAGIAENSFRVSRNKLGFIRTSGPGKRKSISDPDTIRAAGSGKRKSISDPEPRENTRQKMSTNANAAPQTSTAAAAKTNTSKASKLPLKPSKLAAAGTAAAASTTGVGHAGTPHGRDPHAPAGVATVSSEAHDDEIEVSDLSRDLQAVGKILQKTFGDKIDEIKDTLGGRVTKLDKKIDYVEGKITERDDKIDKLVQKVDMIPVDIQRSVAATAVAK